MLNRPARRVALIVGLIGLIICASLPAQAETGSFFERLDNMRWYLQNLGFYPVTEEQLLEGALKGMVKAIGDPYSSYLTDKELSDLLSGVYGTYGGVGMTISLDRAMVKVNSVMKGQPAEESGIRGGDYIVSIDGRSTHELTLTEAATLIKGPPNTKVKLEIWRPGTNQTKVYEVTRRIIQYNPVEWRWEGDVLVITLAEFNEHIVRNLDTALAELKTKTAQGIILDLRNNGGGLLEASLEVAGKFLPPGLPIARVYNADGSYEALKAQSKPAETHLPMVVLVNGGTASASEIVASALRDYGRAKVVGETTYGKGSIQVIYTLLNGGGLKITTSEYTGPFGRKINGVGIEPDHVVTREAQQEPLFAYLDGKRVLKQGMVGLDVLALQRALMAVGHGPIVDQEGWFGSQTLVALKGFERLRTGGPDGLLTEGEAVILSNAWRQALDKDLQLARALELLGGR